jgi:hypothetical protein
MNKWRYWKEPEAFDRHRSYFFIIFVDDGFKQSLDCNLHQQVMILVTQVMWCELIFQTAAALAFSMGSNFTLKRL